ncbi:hypothetical protein Tco_0723395 [Tanacetum coccineum]
MDIALSEGRVPSWGLWARRLMMWGSDWYWVGWLGWWVLVGFVIYELDGKVTEEGRCGGGRGRAVAWGGVGIKRGGGGGWS